MHRVLLLLFALIALPLQAVELLPFSASYTADWEQMPLGGTAGRSLKALDAGRWELSFQASMLVAKLSEVSTFSVENGGLLPLTYRYERSGLGKPRQITYEFDWSGKQLVGSDRGEPVSMPLARGMQDKSTYQLLLQEDVAAGKQSMSYQVIDDDEIDVYDFRVLGPERVQTKAGWINAIKVERVREPAQNSRKTLLWFAKDWDYLLVRLHQVEKDGKEYDILLKEGTVNGRTVEGSKE
jgi:hypothetical protein